MLLPRIRQPTRTLIRCFTSTPTCHGYISNIGRMPVPVPRTVVLTPSATEVTVNGPLGTTSVPLKPYVRLNLPQPDILNVSVEDGAVKEQRQMWGTTRTLIHNAIVGMSEGFTLPVYLVGVGYRAALEPDPRGTTEGNNGQRLNLKLGFSHSIFLPIPAHIKAEVPLPTKIILSCTDKHQLGLFAAKVRRFRPPEPYKGKVRSLADCSCPSPHPMCRAFLWAMKLFG